MSNLFDKNGVVNADLVKKIMNESKIIGSGTFESAEISAFIKPLMPQWQDAPEGSKCNQCGSTNLKRSVIPMGNLWAGTVSCDACGHKESVCSYVAKTMFIVEPLESEIKDVK